MNADELRKIEWRCWNATAGPWRADKAGGGVVSDTPVRDGPMGSDDLEYYGGHLIAESITAKNREFIAHARTDIPKLIAEVRRLYDRG
jgi:hypothetical protein